MCVYMCVYVWYMCVCVCVCMVAWRVCFHALFSILDLASFLLSVGLALNPHTAFLPVPLLLLRTLLFDRRRQLTRLGLSGMQDSDFSSWSHLACCARLSVTPCANSRSTTLPQMSTLTGMLTSAQLYSWSPDFFFKRTVNYIHYIDRKNTRLEGFINSTEITRSSVIIASTHLL
jgi:hypothetical protein